MNGSQPEQESESLHFVPSDDQWLNFDSCCRPQALGSAQLVPWRIGQHDFGGRATERRKTHGDTDVLCLIWPRSLESVRLAPAWIPVA